MTVFTPGLASAIRFTAEMPSMPGSRTSMITTSGLRRSTASTTSSPVSTLPTSSRSRRVAEHQREALAHRGMVIDGKALRGRTSILDSA